MKSNLLISSLLLVSTPFISAQATENLDLYVGLGVGQSSIDITASDLGLENDVSIDDSDTAFKIFGGYDVNKNFAVELGYIELGEASVSSSNGIEKIEAEVDAILASVIGKLPLTDHSSIFVKIGYSSWDIEASWRDMSELNHYTEDGTDVFFGAGYGYSWSNISAGVEFERYDVDGEDVDFISFSLAYMF
ncbi:outer membrane beta-barrel protein [Colwellia sp. BRX10-3]|uniref:outer membrane beta-barrel protein n=1 Tax=Colwellia sp. BRX10-3 TaxID=2759844 RepID=UPI0015F4DBA1|nr:outer membrane beta-barrel protein [Colwellia sp. BRX10-3]MBA6392437.1 outer membrane beta-barrel protein [Colwellia sp. BRX10-3]